MSFGAILRAFSPPSCVVCRRPCRDSAFLCAGCVGELNAESPVWGDPPAGISRAVSCFRHEGVAAGLLRAFKFGRLPGLAPLLAGFMAEHIDAADPGIAVVPVPAAALRRRIRGFDPATLLAEGVIRDGPVDRLASGALRRVDRGRQRGRGRDARLEAPPVIVPVGPLRGPVLLVDDVITTGATVSACAAALMECGSGPVAAISFTRRV